MKIINKNGLSILLPENGYELVSKLTGAHSEKVYLSKLDSMDNYIEVMKEGFVAGLNDLKEQKDIEIALLIETIDSLIMLLEPILMSIPFTIRDNSNNPIEKLIDFYIEIIKRGFKDIEDVPMLLKDLIQDKYNL